MKSNLMILGIKQKGLTNVKIKVKVWLKGYMEECTACPLQVQVGLESKRLHITDRF